MDRADGKASSAQGRPWVRSGLFLVNKLASVLILQHYQKEKTGNRCGQVKWRMRQLLAVVSHVPGLSLLCSLAGWDGDRPEGEGKGRHQVSLWAKSTAAADLKGWKRAPLLSSCSGLGGEVTLECMYYLISWFCIIILQFCCYGN